MLGSGAIIVIDDSVPIVDVALRLAGFYRHESCGKCTPCREGTNWTVKMLERVDRGEATPMDIEIIAQVQDEHHRQLPVRARRLDGDADRLDDREVPRRVRAAHRAAPAGARAQQDYALSAQELGAARRPALPRPEQRMVTFEIDGREVTAPEGVMLVDGAKHGDVEIPVFCYEPKIGPPVGACRMCLVEIEGIPKLQTACSTPVKDGMVVITTSDRVKAAQEAVVEFLLINHPLDCPVCDKGGECPLQDISFGWGAGRSRMIEPKRHFKKPIELSPADRDRPRALHPLLPLRALLAGGGRGLPAGLPRARRPHLRRHERRRAVRRAVQRQHRRALPGRRADVDLVPLPRAAVGRRGLGLDLRALPEPVQHRVHRPRRRAHRARDGARQRGRRGRLAVRQGPLRLPGDPLAGAGDAADGLGRRRAARDVVGARAGRCSHRAREGGRRDRRPSPAARRRTRRASCCSASCAKRSARRTSTRARAACSTPTRRACWRGRTSACRCGTSRTRATVLVFDTDLVEEAPIVDLRVRKARRRHGATVVVASSHPTTLDAIADHAVRFPPGGAEAALQELAEHDPRGGGPVVIIWGERPVARRARTAGRRRAARAGAQAEPRRPQRARA